MRLFHVVNAAATLLLLFDLFVAQPEPPAPHQLLDAAPVSDLQIEPSDRIRVAVALTEDDEFIITDSIGVVASFPADSLRILASDADSSRVEVSGNLLTELIQHLEAIEQSVENCRESLTDGPGTWQFPSLLQCLKIE